MKTKIYLSHGEGPDECETEFVFDLELAPGESNFGADADGNRGMYVPDCYVPAEDVPESCPTCGYAFNKEELKTIEKQMELAAADEVPEDDDDFDAYDDRYVDEGDN